MLNIKQMIVSNWHFMRVLRLGAGLFIAYQAWQDGTILVGLLGSIFIFQAISNTGCCASGTCAVQSGKETRNSRHNN